jgi:hypothetical protein
MMEYFAASGGPPLAACLAKVSPCDLVVVLIAERYGWVPPDQGDHSVKSVTWLECERAARQGKDILVFTLDGNASWPTERTEAYRLTAAFNEGAFTPELPAEIQRNVTSLQQFRKWLEKGRMRATFANPDDLRAKLIQALFRWIENHSEYAGMQPDRLDPKFYLSWLRDQCATIDVRGLGLGAGKAHNFPIEDLYIPLTTRWQASTHVSDREQSNGGAQIGLEEALQHSRLVIVGDPGSGKTTFLRRIAFELADNALGEDNDRPSSAVGISSSAQVIKETSLLRSLLSVLRWETHSEESELKPGKPFPILVRIAELVEYIGRSSQQAGRNIPSESDSEDWLTHFLSTQNKTLGWGLSDEVFANKLNGGTAIVLLDGLDEAPDRLDREHAASLLENSTKAFSKSRFVITTRPGAYGRRGPLDGFYETYIEPLTFKAIHTFLDHWCRGLYPESRRMAEEHRKELSDALRARPDIRSMASNPVMLTALAVVHWNERRLPEQRADLYDSILTWLSRQRERKPGREKPERCLTILGQLAFAMQDHIQGRQVHVPLEWAAEALASEFGPIPKPERLQRAVQFLEQEAVDSGIIVKRGDLQFWHLTFHEYLAAQAIAGQMESEQAKLLFRHGRIYEPEWREVALLLAGILAVKQGRAKVEGLVSAILKRSGDELSDRARTAGLLGAMVKDLRPLDYSPSDARYADLMEDVLGIFEQKIADNVDFDIRLEAAEALGQAGDPRITWDNWVRIDAGSVRSRDPRGLTFPLKAYDIGAYPVTVAEFRRFVEDDGFGDDRWWRLGGYAERKEPTEWEKQKMHPNHPIGGVNWYEAAAYCAWAGARLPTEAEWERAACGTEGRRYPWGNAVPDRSRANFPGIGPQRTTPVGMYPAGATPEGVLDLAGNVWEWIDERFADAEQRILRGGSWASPAVTNRGTAERIRCDAKRNNIDFGFRLVRKST